MIALLIVCMGLLGLSLTGCEKKQQDIVVTTHPFDVVATYSILGDLVKQVGGEQVTVKTLVGAGGDAHTYEPTPADSVRLAKSVLLFENGLAFESWLDKLYKASGSKAKRIVVSKEIKPRRLDLDDEGDHHEEHAEHDHDAHDDHKEHAEHEHEHESEHAHEHHHHHGEFDPHVWHDVTNVISMVNVIAGALQKVDPANAQQYQTNAEHYVAELMALDDWIKQEVARIPAKNRKLVTTHDAYNYFAKRYGFEVVSVLGSISSDVADPSAADVARVVDAIKSFGVPAVFAENIINPKFTRQIAQQSGVKVVGTLYSGALGKVGSDGDTYIKMMRANVSTMVKVLAK
jgi:ABC-type Zn uptake system ZnuABC Zn-binding protein ZnuA